MLEAVIALLTLVAPPEAWAGAHTRRADLSITTDAGVAAGYAVSLIFDHAAQLDAGVSPMAARHQRPTHGA
ncbi:MAG: hypothetical protein JNM17_08285 [Archangium sp.]|nr:hypothetical protein [Archangium sp.]